MSKELIEQLAKEHGEEIEVTHSDDEIGDFHTEYSFDIDQLEAMFKAYAQTQTQGQSNWISVDERLPDVGLQVLVFPSDALPIRYMKKDGDDVVWFFSALPVTHWMPLPAAPIESGVKG